MGNYCLSTIGANPRLTQACRHRAATCAILGIRIQQPSIHAAVHQSLITTIMSNTYSSSLITEHLEEAATTKLSDALAPLNAFTKGFSPDSYKPRAKVELKFTTSGSTTKKNPTDFEDGDSQVDAVGIVVDLY